jgi:hypothetical protein
LFLQAFLFLLLRGEEAEKLCVGVSKFVGGIANMEDGVAIKVDGVVGTEVGEDHRVFLLAELVDRQHLRSLLADLLRHVHLDRHFALFLFEVMPPSHPLPLSEDGRLIRHKGLSNSPALLLFDSIRNWNFIPPI